MFQLLTIVLLAAPPAGQVVRYRQSVMKALSAHLNAASAIAAKKVPYEKQLPAHARGIAELSSSLSELFPPDTAPDKTATDALPSVWSDAKKFAAALDAMKADAEKLRLAVESGKLDAVRTQAEAVSDTCAACHEKFRKER